MRFFRITDDFKSKSKEISNIPSSIWKYFFKGDMAYQREADAVVPVAIVQSLCNDDMIELNNAIQISKNFNSEHKAQWWLSIAYAYPELSDEDLQVLKDSIWILKKNWLAS